MQSSHSCKIKKKTNATIILIWRVTNELRPDPRWRADGLLQATWEPDLKTASANECQEQFKTFKPAKPAYINPLKYSGVRRLHLNVFNAIQV